MPVQQRSIPYMLNKRDVMVQSRTGSGKTGAFVLPSIERIDPKVKACQVLILTPTRELANQIANEAAILGKETGLRSIAVYGGVSYEPQRKAFKEGAHLVIGTPGRVLDHLLNGNLKLDKLRILLLDEADRMLSVGFYPDMKAVQRYLPKENVNTCMFSATFPPHVMRLADEFQDNPAILSLSSDHVHVTDVQHVMHTVTGIDKERVLVRLIEVENPESAIIFCNTKAKVNYVSVVLKRFGFDADQLSGDLAQHKREKVLGRVRQGNLRLLVATDVAARGIDIPNLSHVFQYDVPQDPEQYIHRAGRTGRAGASGTAITLAELLDTIKIKKISRQYEIDMLTNDLPTDDDVEEVVAQRVSVSLEAQLRAVSPVERQQIEAFEPMTELLVTNADGIRALAMLLDDHYQGMRKHSTVAIISANKPKQTELIPVDDAVMQKVATAMHKHLQTRDQVQNERIQRFEPLVEALAMSGEEFYILPLLLANYHAALSAPKAAKPKREKAKKDGKGKSKDERPKKKADKPKKADGKKRGARDDGKKKKRDSAEKSKEKK